MAGRKTCWWKASPLTRMKSKLAASVWMQPLPMNCPVIWRNTLATLGWSFIAPAIKEPGIIDRAAGRGILKSNCSIWAWMGLIKNRSIDINRNLKQC